MICWDTFQNLMKAPMLLVVAIPNDDIAQHILSFLEMIMAMTRMRLMVETVMDTTKMIMVFANNKDKETAMKEKEQL